MAPLPERASIPHFCHQISYTSSAWRRILSSPDRLDTVRAPIDSLGGTLHSVFFAMDSFDVLAISEFPDSVTPSDISVAFFSSGDVAQIRSTQLVDAPHALDAMRRSGPPSYSPSPGNRHLTASAS